MVRPKNILEIGTFTGYSAICLAQGLQEGGVLHTIDINEELKEIITRYVKEAGLNDKIRLHIGSAVNILPTLKTTFDLVFIDADKENVGGFHDTYSKCFLRRSIILRIIFLLALSRYT